VSALSSCSHRRLARIAVIGALVAALGLAGCGRKGGLDPPPGASVVDQGAPPPGTVAEVGPDGRPLAPPPPNKRSTPIDWLLN
jgi:predicted small lipoprotein YifL